MTYQEQLRDRRWIAKKNEILERDNHKCQSCNEDNPPFDVHHTFYQKGRMAWEYDNSHLITLCDLCHDLISNEVKKANSNILGNTKSLRRITLVRRITDGLLNLDSQEIGKVEDFIKKMVHYNVFGERWQKDS